MILRYTPQARLDLHRIEDYIRNELSNPIAAENVTRRILLGCSNLKSNPRLGLDLSSKIQRKTDLKYLVLSKYIVVYRIEKDLIEVIRIFDGRTEYLSYLF